MPGWGRVEWLGKEIEARLIVKTIEAADVTLKAAADDAIQHHWWANRTGDLEKNTVAAPARLEGAVVRGKFGSSMRAEGFYGLFLERRTPWLRPAADRHFPEFRVVLAKLWRR